MFREDLDEVVEIAAGDEEELAAGRLDVLQGGERARLDEALAGERLVVVGGEGDESHGREPAHDGDLRQRRVDTTCRWNRTGPPLTSASRSAFCCADHTSSSAPFSAQTSMRSVAPRRETSRRLTCRRCPRSRPSATRRMAASLRTTRRSPGVRIWKTS